MRKHIVILFLLFIIAFNLLAQEKERNTIDVVLLGTFHYGSTSDASRTDFSEIPLRVAYSLSEKGESLRDIMHLLSNWSREHTMSETGISGEENLKPAS